MIVYFVDGKASDNLPASDIKSISDQAYALSERGHIQNSELATDFGSNYNYTGKVPPGNEKDYNLQPVNGVKR